VPETLCPECGKTTGRFVRGYCARCYRRLLGSGALQPMRPHPRRGDLDKWIEAMRAVDGCWLWTKEVNPNGYGHVSVAGSYGLVHRIVYERLVGPIPTGRDLDHECHNQDERCRGGVYCPHRRCANPAHLVPATRPENLSRGRRGKRSSLPTHCRRGHELFGENLTIDGGKRRCLKCAADGARRRRGSTRPRHGQETHCPQGHPYDGDNLRIDAKGYRRCRACNRERSQRNRDAQRAAR
jgi:hypothetical protein